jgi:hypothetical protein
MPETEIFREKETIGRLMGVKPDPLTGLKLVIWFDYTRKLTNAIREGDLVAIPNFSADDAYSVCQIIQSLPAHFAMPQNLEGYPGFTMEAAKSACQDWIIQEKESYEDTTKIVCQAVPIDLEFKDIPGLTSIDAVPLQQESSMVMPGKEVRLLSTAMLNKIMNLMISPMKDNFNIGTLVRDKKVDILVDVEDFVKTHFGIFGFTGVGKSNLLSAVIRKLLSNSNNIKIVLFDLAGEYTALLIDLLSVTDVNSHIVCLGERTLPDSMIRYMGVVTTAPPSRATLNSVVSSPATPEPESNVNVGEISQRFLNTILLPRTLDTLVIREKMKPYVTDLIESHKIKIHRELARLNVRAFIGSLGNVVYKQLGEPKKLEIRQYLDQQLRAFFDQALNPQVARQVADRLRSHQSSDETVQKRVNVIIDKMEGIAREAQISIRPEYSIAINDIASDVNNGEDNSRSLYVIVSSDPDSVRSFSNRLIDTVYESRRSTGTKAPIVCFIFDEADEFIPAMPSGTYQESTDAVETLARRGRKYGLGVGLATQRVTYLNTSIMAQPHTYFVSRLPRKTDRERVAEAFSMDEDLFQQTFKFRKGDWLIMSHEALGIQSTPIPITVENAEERIRKFLDKPHGRYILHDLNPDQ